MKHQLFIGITSWNSQLLLGASIQSVIQTTKCLNPFICVLDNYSNDRSCEIAHSFGINVIRHKSTQPQAINYLINKSKADYTLIIHSDVVMLDINWFYRCAAKLNESTILLSPEDIGCGPLTRPFGRGMPESSFLFFRTKELKSCRTWEISRPRRWSVSIRKKIDLSGSHLTHKLPSILASKSYHWHPMQVHPSPKEDYPLYKPSKRPSIWSDELCYLRYGLGNFYAVDKKITHYHNWYDRVVGSGLQKDLKRGKEFPQDFILDYTQRFLRDLNAKNLVLPTNLDDVREPQSL